MRQDQNDQRFNSEIGRYAKSQMDPHEIAGSQGKDRAVVSLIGVDEVKLNTPQDWKNFKKLSRSYN